MLEIRAVASKAVKKSLRQVENSSKMLLGMGYANGSAPKWRVPVISIEELAKEAVTRLGSEEALREKITQALSRSGKTDLRDLAVVSLQEIHLNSGLGGPMLVVGFLPPYYPARNNNSASPKF